VASAPAGAPPRPAAPPPPPPPAGPAPMKKGGKVKSASSRADGIAVRGKTRA
jgi:hypothetical protein